MAGGLNYTLGLNTAGFTGPLGIAKASLGGFLGIASSMGNITTGLASAKGLIGDVVGALNQPIGLAADVEALNMSFRSLLKDGDAAKSLVGDLMRFADKTPFEPGPVAEAGKQLLAFGVAAEGIIPLLTDVGDLAAAMDKPLDQVADTFGRLKAGQFGEAFERMRAFGISMQDLTGAGLEFDKSGSFQGSAEQAMEAVRQIIRRKFGGGMADLSGTYKGIFSTFKGYWDQLLTKFGEPIMGSLKPLLEEATGQIREWTPAAREFGQTIADALAGVRGLFLSGELGSTLGNALTAAGQIFLGNVSTGVGAAVKLLGVGIKAAFSSGVALLGDGNFWKGLMQSALGITHAVRASLLDTVGFMIDKLPTAFQLGADTKGLRDMASSARGSSDLARRKAEDAFGLVNWHEVMMPIEQGVAEGGAILGDTFAQVRDSVVNNPALQEAAKAFASASKGAPAQSLRDYLAEASRAGGDMLLAGGRSGRAFIPTAEGGYSAPALPLNTARLDQIMGRNSQAGGGIVDKWTQKIYENGQKMLDELKGLRSSSEPAGAFL